MRRATVLTTLCSTAVVVGAVLVPPTAQAADVNEVYPRPADGVYDLNGHGWGHGRGMSQYGALGAAKLGKTADQITSTYYPGTTKKVVADTPIRVLVSDDGVDTRVQPASGLRFRDVASGIGGTLPAGVTAWRAVASAGSMQVQGLVGSTWTTRAFGGRSTFVGPIRFGGVPSVRIVLPGGVWRDYRGDTYAIRTGAATLQTVVSLPMESYLLGVVPRESPSSWPAAALQAQAIAARSYSMNKRDRVAGKATYDICDTTACQVFGGTRVRAANGTVTELEAASTTSAVRQTAGVIRAYGGSAIFAEFSSSNGGYSTAGGFPYLVAKADPWDGAFPNSVHGWNAALPVSALERAFPQIGSLQQLRITGRDGRGEWGGRVTGVVLTGSKGSVSTDGRAIYLARTWPAVADGLKHQWFRPLPEPAAPAPAPVPAPAPAAGPAYTVRSSPAYVLVKRGATVRISARVVRGGAEISGAHTTYHVKNKGVTAFTQRRDLTANARGLTEPRMLPPVDFRWYATYVDARGARVASSVTNLVQVR